MCVCVSDHRGQKSALDVLELELQGVENSKIWVLDIKIRSAVWATRVLKYWSIFSFLKFYFEYQLIHLRIWKLLRCQRLRKWKSAQNVWARVHPLILGCERQVSLEPWWTFSRTGEFQWVFRLSPIRACIRNSCVRALLGH